MLWWRFGSSTPSSFYRLSTIFMWKKFQTHSPHTMVRLRALTVGIHYLLSAFFSVQAILKLGNLALLTVLSFRFSFALYYLFIWGRFGVGVGAAIDVFFFFLAFVPLLKISRMNYFCI